MHRQTFRYARSDQHASAAEQQQRAAASLDVAPTDARGDAVVAAETDVRPLRTISGMLGSALVPVVIFAVAVISLIKPDAQESNPRSDVVLSAVNVRKTPKDPGTGKSALAAIFPRLPTPKGAGDGAS